MPHMPAESRSRVNEKSVCALVQAMGQAPARQRRRCLFPQDTGTSRYGYIPNRKTSRREARKSTLLRTVGLFHQKRKEDIRARWTNGHRLLLYFTGTFHFQQ